MGTIVIYSRIHTRTRVLRAIICFTLHYLRGLEIP